MTAPVDTIRVGLKLAQCYGGNGHRIRQQGALAYLWSRYPLDAKRFQVPNPVVPNLLVPVNNATNSNPSPPRPRPSVPPPSARPAGLPQLPAPPQPTPYPQ